VRDGLISPLELVDAHLRRIERRNPSINAFVTVLGDAARETAGALEASGTRELLFTSWGAPIRRFASSKMPSSLKGRPSYSESFPLVRSIPWLR